MLACVVGSFCVLSEQVKSSEFLINVRFLYLAQFHCSSFAQKAHKTASYAGYARVGA